MKIRFRKIRMSKANQERLDVINDIVTEYQEEGYVLTLRQLYYQLVSRDVIPNDQKEYKKLGGLLMEGRMAGIVDWGAIEDRLRRPESPASFDNPEDILKAAISQYQVPRQEGQHNYIEVWVEKDALSGVLKRVTQPYHVPILVNRGYSSASAMFESFQRFKTAHENGQSVKVIYLGDFDPSGLDMIRDIRDRSMEFIMGYRGLDDIDEALEQYPLEVVPVALTKAQIDKYEPPKNPAKVTDSRFAEFERLHGGSSWEVDALRPEVLNQILEDAITDFLDIDQYNRMRRREKGDKDQLKGLFVHLKDRIDSDEEE